MNDFASLESMIDIFLTETNDLLDKLDDILLCAEKSDCFSDDDVNEIFRIMHTIKGSSAMMQYKSMTSISHKIEDMFSYIRNNRLNNEFKDPVFNLLFDACDFLKGEISNIRNGTLVDTDISEFELRIDDILLNIKFKINQNKDEPFIYENDLEVIPNVDNFKYKTNISMQNNTSNTSNLNQNYEKSKPIEIYSDTTEDIDQKTNHQYIVYPNNTGSSNDKVPHGDVIQNYMASTNLCSDSDLNCYAVRIFFDDNCGMEHLRAYLLIESIRDSATGFSYFPENIENNPACCKDIIENGFIINFKNRKDFLNAKHIIEDSINVKNYDVIENFLIEEYEQVKIGSTENIPEIPKSNSIVQHNIFNEIINNDVFSLKNIKQNLINVNLSKLDQLMDIVGEIVITESIVNSIPEIKALKLDSFSKASSQLRKLITNLQNHVMSIRMVPISLVFQKMNRIVRDMCKKLQKSVELVLIGEDTEVDKTIIDTIADPLIHIIRNSIDHGIEFSELRTELGKPDTGKIILFAQNTGGEILIIVSDDGCGINTEHVLNEAAKNGLLTKPSDEYTEKEIIELILMPGFSTKEDITEFSGRGVGMDIVCKNIEKIGGSVTIESVEGASTTVFIKIPITLAIISALQVVIGKQIYNIPLNCIKQAMEVKKSEVIVLPNGKKSIIRNGINYTIIPLYAVFDIPTNVISAEDGILVEIIAEGSQNYCILVDKVLGEQQVVVKPLPEYLNMFNIKKYGFNGCTILGNGDISIIIDVYSIIDYVKGDTVYGE